MNLRGRFRAGQGANTKRFLRPQWKSPKSLFAGRRRRGSKEHWWCWTGKHLLPYWPVPSGTWTPGPFPPSSGCLQPFIFLLVPAKGLSVKSWLQKGYQGLPLSWRGAKDTIVCGLNTKPKDLLPQGQDLAMLGPFHQRSAGVHGACGWVSLGSHRAPGPGESTNWVLWDANETLM